MNNTLEIIRIWTLNILYSINSERNKVMGSGYCDLKLGYIHTHRNYYF